MNPEPLKQSTIYVDVDGTTRVYSSVDEVPEPLRRKLLAPNHWNSATILIADRRGRVEIAKALRGGPSALRCRFLDSLRIAENKASARPARLLPYLRWIAALLFPATALLIWFLFSGRS